MHVEFTDTREDQKWRDHEIEKHQEWGQKPSDTLRAPLGDDLEARWDDLRDGDRDAEHVAPAKVEAQRVFHLSRPSLPSNADAQPRGPLPDGSRCPFGPVA